MHESDLDPAGQTTVPARSPLKTLFLQAPSFDGFDGGAGVLVAELIG